MLLRWLEVACRFASGDLFEIFAATPRYYLVQRPSPPKMGHNFESEEPCFANI